MFNIGEKGRYLTQSYDKAPTPTEKNPTSNVTNKTIADRLRTVSRSRVTTVHTVKSTVRSMTTRLFTWYFRFQNICNRNKFVWVSR